MQDDPLNEEEEIEEPLDGADEEEAEDDVPVDSDDVDYSAGSKAASTEALEDFSIASRQKARDELQDQIAAFLARGGKIQEIDANVTADPPKKPTPDYGGRPI